MKTILEKLKACKEAIEWVEDKTIEEAVNECPRGAWMLWLAQRLDADLKALTLAKGHCANTVRHLMVDERSTKAVDVAIAFGMGEATEEELVNANKAAYDAYAAASAASYAASDATAYAAYATASAAYAAASTAAYAAAASTAYAAASASASAASTAAYAAAASTAYAAAYAEATRENQLLMANICREHLGQFIIGKCNLLKSE